MNGLMNGLIVPNTNLVFSYRTVFHQADKEPPANNPHWQLAHSSLPPALSSTPASLPHLSLPLVSRSVVLICLLDPEPCNKKIITQLFCNNKESHNLIQN